METPGSRKRTRSTRWGSVALLGMVATLVAGCGQTFWVSQVGNADMSVGVGDKLVVDMAPYETVVSSNAAVIAPLPRSGGTQAFYAIKTGTDVISGNNNGHAWRVSVLVHQ